MQRVVQLVVQPVVQPVVSCKRGLTFSLTRPNAVARTPSTLFERRQRSFVVFYFSIKLVFTVFYFKMFCRNFYMQSESLPELWRRPPLLQGDRAPPGSETSTMTRSCLTWSWQRQEMRLKSDISGECWLRIALRTHSGAC